MRFQKILLGLALASLVSPACVRATAAHPASGLAELPLGFEQNTGQVALPGVNFLSRGGGYRLYLGPTEAAVVLAGAVPDHDSRVLRLRLLGANRSARGRGVEEHSGRANYFVGDRARWRTGVPTFAKVKYADVYPGVDLVYYGNGRLLEYDFVVAPGADPGAVRLQVLGASQARLTAAGDLVLDTPAGAVELRRPAIYQDHPDGRRTVSGHYVLASAGEVRFQVGAYDARKPLVIDPVLAYSTHVGGSDDERGFAIAVDAAGNAYVAGHTRSLDFPAPDGVHARGTGGFDAFVLKLDPTGSQVLYATYLGGSGAGLDEALGIAVDSAGNAFVAGTTASTDFPTTAASLQAATGGGVDAFVAKLDPTGSRLLYSTYLGGAADDGAAAVAVDASGRAHVTGDSRSRNFPTAGVPFQAAPGGGVDAFIATLDASGSRLLSATFLGGRNDDSGHAIALDAAGRAFVAGETRSPDFPTRAAVQPAKAGGVDAFVATLDADGSHLEFSTYLGGKRDDAARGVAVDGSATVYATGETASGDFPVVRPLQRRSGGGADAWIAKISPADGLVYSTYLGGRRGEAGRAVAVTSDGDAFVTGSTRSTDFPTTTPLQAANAGRLDAFLVRLPADGARREFSTYLGGAGHDAGYGVAVTPTGDAYVTGEVHRTGADVLVARVDHAAPTAAADVAGGATGEDAGTAGPPVVAPAAIATISGTVFEDVNYGGGAGRTRVASGGVVRNGARVELYGSTGNFLLSTTTNASGLFSFVNQQDNTTYTVRVVSSTVTSSRPGAVGTLVPVQTFRTNATTGTAVADTARVGGEDPSKVDAASNTTNANLSTLITATTAAQSITPVTVGVGVTSLGGLDVGFNFDTIVSTRNTGQGSLRQFITNARTLGGDASLAQSGSRKNASNANTALPAARDSSVFMIPDGAAHPGLRAGLTNQLNGSGVAVISVTTLLPQLTGANATNTIVDGTTQTVNVGDTNAGQLGAGGSVGLGTDGLVATGDELTLSQVYRPEVQVMDGNALALGFDVQANDVTIRGVSVYGFGTTANANGSANIRIGNATNITGALIEQNIVGAAATSFTDPGAGARSVGDNIRSVGADAGTVRNNLIGYSDGKGFAVEDGSTGWTIDNNEIRGNAISNRHLDGIDVENGTSGTATVRGNLVIANKGVGVDSFSGAGGNTIVNNTITGNGRGTVGGSPVETAGVRVYGTGSVVDRNLIFDNYGAGIMVASTSTGNRFTRNSIYDNGQVTSDTGGAATNQIGIDLLAAANDVAAGTSPFVTVNDNGDADGGANGLLNYPILSTAGRTGAFLVLTGFARPGSAIELFVADAAGGASPPAGFGEGRTYVTTLTEGSASDTDAATGTYGPGAINGLAQGTDTTNRYRFQIALPSGVTTGTVLTATATVGGATSEFAGNVTVANSNTTPAATADPYSTPEDASLTVSAPGVLGNDTDADGDPLTAVLVTGPANGSLSLNANGSFTYTPNGNFSGSDSFTYRASDGVATSGVTTVTITVSNVNDPPNAVDDTATVAEDSGTTSIDVRANDTGVPDTGETLSVTGVTQPANGTVAITGGGTAVSFTPAANFTGATSFTYTLSDGNGGTDTATVSVTVTSVNDPPDAVDDATTVAEDSGATSIDVRANDTGVPDTGETLSVTGVTQPANGTVAITGGGTAVSFTPAANFTGATSFTYTLSDGNGGTDTATVSVTVTNVNDPPNAVDDAATVSEDSGVNPIDVRANDTAAPDTGETLTIIAVTQGSDGTVAITGGGTGLTYTPNADFAGSDSFGYTVSDGNGGTDTATVTMTVTNVNDPPTVVDDSATVAEDSGVTTIPVLANDSGAPDAGETLTVTGVTQGAHGTVTIVPGGTGVRYTPDPDFTGTDTFTYSVNDGNGGTQGGIVTVSVTPVNDAPVGLPDAYSTPEDVPLTIAAGPGVLANDTDVEGDPLSVVLVDGPQHGSLILNPDGSFTYTPSQDFNGSDGFTYQARDGVADSGVVQVVFTIGATNDAPVARDDNFSTLEDVPRTLAIPGVMVNDTDADGDLLTAVLVANAQHGAAVLNPDGSFTYTPDLNYNGTDTFTYQLSDGTDTGNVATVTFTVGVVNDAPVGVDDAYAMLEDDVLPVVVPGVLGNDTDVESDPLTAVLVVGPQNGAIQLNADGSFSYTPDADFAGLDGFVYQVTDGVDDGNLATVTITVTNVNDPPQAVNDAATVAEDSGATVIAVLPNDLTAPDAGESLTVTAVTQGAHGAVAISGTGVSYTPAADYAGADTFTYTIDDGNGGTDTATVTVTVTSANDAPVAVEDVAAVPEDGSVVIDVLDNDSDVDGDTLHLTIVSPPAHGTATVDDRGTPGDPTDDDVVYTPAPGFSGGDSFVYGVDDGNGGSTSATVMVDVLANNVPPVAVIADAAEPLDGAVGEELEFDGSSSFDVDGVVVTYTWDFGDGSPPDPTSGAHARHVYAAPGTYVVQLVVTDAEGATSTIAATRQVVAGNTQPLYVRKGKLVVRWKRHAKGVRADAFAFKGNFNPRRMRTDLSQATATIRLGGATVVDALRLDASGRFVTAPGVTPRVRCRVKSKTGAYRCTIRRADLRGLIDLPTDTSKGFMVLDASLEIAGADLAAPVASGRYEFAYTARQGKVTRAVFKYGLHRTLTGVYLSLKTRARTVRKGGYKVVARGVVFPVGALPLVPTGDLALTVGDSRFQVPLAALVRTGESDATSKWVYSRKRAPVPGLLRFVLNNRTRKFKIVTLDPAGSGIPPIQPNTPMATDLQVRIEAPTADGSSVSDTTVELKRPLPTAKRWKR